MHPVPRVFTPSAHGYPRVSQMITNMPILRRRLTHPNVVPCIGATVDPFQTVVERAPDRNIMEYLKKYPGANRISLVSPVLFIAFER